MSFEIKKRLKKISYTLKHKKAFLSVERKLRGHNTLSGYLHDLDKPFLYLCLWLDLKEIQSLHRKISKHHVKNNLNKTKDDLLDTIIDWECARLTKPDKPLNAYETLMKFYPQYQDTFLPLIKEYLPSELPKPQKRNLALKKLSLEDIKRLYYAPNSFKAFNHQKLYYYKSNER
jgi:hypothetical protein